MHVSIRDDYNHYLNHRRSKNIHTYIRDFEQGKVFTEIAVFAIVDNVPEVRIIKFWNENPPQFPPKVVYDIIKNPAIEVLGTSLDFSLLSIEQKTKLIEESIANPQSVIEEIILEQGAKQPDFVGGATDILQLNSEGQVWIARKPNCTD